MITAKEIIRQEGGKDVTRRLIGVTVHSITDEAGGPISQARLWVTDEELEAYERLSKALHDIEARQHNIVIEGLLV